MQWDIPSVELEGAVRFAAGSRERKVSKLGAF